MDYLRAMIQDELKQTLARLIPSLVAKIVPLAPIIPYVVVPLNNGNVLTGGQPLNATTTVPTVEMKFKKVEDYMT